MVFAADCRHVLLDGRFCPVGSHSAKGINMTTATPRRIWIALGAITAGVSVVVFGYLQGKSTPEGFQGAATVALSGLIGALLSFAGIICACAGARRRPWSRATKVAVVLSCFAGLALAVFAIRITVALSN
jgi:hypothetical protein